VKPIRALVHKLAVMVEVREREKRTTEKRIKRSDDSAARGSTTTPMERDPTTALTPEGNKMVIRRAKS